MAGTLKWPFDGNSHQHTPGVREKSSSFLPFTFLLTALIRLFRQDLPAVSKNQAGSERTVILDAIMSLQDYGGGPPPPDLWQRQQQVG